MGTCLFYDPGFSFLASAEFNSYADVETITSLIFLSVWGSLIQHVYIKKTVIIFCLLT